MRHVGDVQQAVDSAKVDESTEVRDVLDDTFANLTGFQFGHQLLLCVSTFFLNQRAAADDDVTTLVVNFQHFTLNDATDVIADVARSANIHLAGWQEDGNADIDQQTAFDFSSTSSGDDIALGHFRDHVHPVDDVIGFSLADRDQARRIVGAAHLVLKIFDQNLNRLTNFWLVDRVVPLAARNGTFTLKADIDHNMIRIDANDLSFNDLVQFVLLIG